MRRVDKELIKQRRLQGAVKIKVNLSNSAFIIIYTARRVFSKVNYYIVKGNLEFKVYVSTINVNLSNSALKIIDNAQKDC